MTWRIWIVAVLLLAGCGGSGGAGRPGRPTPPGGRLIDASGVVAYPLKIAGASSPLLSFQHATIFSDIDAPSAGANSDAALLALAGSGFIVAMPDYIGYVASTAEIHTYVHARGLAASIVDMLRG